MVEPSERGASRLGPRRLVGLALASGICGVVLASVGWVWLDSTEPWRFVAMFAFWIALAVATMALERGTGSRWLTVGAWLAIVAGFVGPPLAYTGLWWMIIPFAAPAVAIVVSVTLVVRQWARTGRAPRLAYVLVVVAIAAMGVLFGAVALIFGGGAGGGEGSVFAIATGAAWLVAFAALLICHRKGRPWGTVVAFVSAGLIAWTVVAFVARMGYCVMESCTVPHLGFGGYVFDGASASRAGAPGAWWAGDVAFATVALLALVSTTAAAAIAFAPLKRSADGRGHTVPEWFTVAAAGALLVGSVGIGVWVRGRLETTDTQVSAQEAALRERCSQEPHPGVDWHGCDLSGADLHGANLSGTDLRSVLLEGANLAGADLSGAKLGFAIHANLAGANLSGADITSALLSGADLTGADLTGASGSHAGLSDATLAGADLSGASLPEALFFEADLRGASLAGAVLTHASFNGADLSDADLAGADLTGVFWGNTTCPDGSNSDVHGGTCRGYSPPDAVAAQAAAALTSHGVDLAWHASTPADGALATIVGRRDPTGPAENALAGSVAVHASDADADANARALGDRTSSILGDQGYTTYYFWLSCGRLAITYVVGYRPPTTQEQATQESDRGSRAMADALVAGGLC